MIYERKYGVGTVVETALIDTADDKAIATGLTFADGDMKLSSDQQALTNGAAEYAAFTSGSEEPQPGDTIANNSQTAVVCGCFLTSGTWAGGDAAGFIFLEQVSGALAAGAADISGGTSDVLTLSGDTTVRAIVASGYRVLIGLTSTELSCREATVQIKDQGSDTWLDDGFKVSTYGDADAQHVTNRGAAIPTLSEFNARTLPSGDYGTADPGDEMALIDDAITEDKISANGVNLIQSGLAQTGADGDTLETLSDQLDLQATATELAKAKENTDYPDGWTIVGGPFCAYGASGTVAGVNGTQRSPSLSWSDAYTIALARLCRRLKYTETIWNSAPVASNNLEMNIGQGVSNFIIDLGGAGIEFPNAMKASNRTRIQNGFLYGKDAETLTFEDGTGGMYFKDVVFGSAVNFDGRFSTAENCKIALSWTFLASASPLAMRFLRCQRYNSSASIIFDMGGQDGAVQWEDWSGDVELKNATDAALNLDWHGNGILKIFDSCTAGTIHVSGMYVVDEDDVEWVNGVGKPTVTMVSSDAPTVEEIRTEMDDNSAKLAAIATDVAGLDGAAMRGTDGAYTGTPPTASQNAAAVWTHATAVSFINALSTLATKVRKYFQLIARKDAPIAVDNATELAEINANEGTGAGGFVSTTDSLQNIKDTGGGGGGGGTLAGNWRFETDRGFKDVEITSLD